MKKTLFYTILISACSALLIYISRSVSEGNVNNGFSRKFITPTITLKSVIILPNKSFAFLGTLNKKIILFNYADKIHLFPLNATLSKLDTTTIKFPTGFYMNGLNVYKDIQAPLLFLGNAYGDVAVSNGSTTIPYKIKGVHFDNFKAISDRTLIVRARHNYGSQKNRSLARLSLADSVRLKKDYPFPNVKDALFTNDGWLQYDKKNARILYMYYYKGEFLTLDTNLNLLYKGKTVDTVRTANITTGVVTTKTKNGFNKSITQTTPPKVVNAYMTTYNNLVYVISRLKADNETKSEFAKNQVIDVYDLRSGKYLYSFYIRRYIGNKLNQFLIEDNRLIAIFETFLVSYNFSSQQ